MNSKLILIGVGTVIIAVAGIGGLYLMNNKSGSAPQTNEMAVPSSATVTEKVTEPDTTMTSSEITVEGGEFKFTPSEITVKKGEKITLTFKNTGSFPHDFTIADLNVATKRIQPGETDTVEFTPEETGEFKIICGVGNHEEQGMTGVLVVE